ncbi:MAG: histidine kinase [Bacteroidota bacterium]
MPKIKKQYLQYGSIIFIVMVELLAYYFAEELAIETTLVITISWFTTVIILLWLGNRLITQQFNKYFPWLKYGTKRFYAHLVVGIIYSLVIMNLTYIIFKVLLTADPPVYEQIIVMNSFGLAIFIPLFSIYFSIHFLNQWKGSELVAEKFKKETVHAELVSLKNHLDPHFLFNNLNILSSLIDKDKGLSKDFLDKFAEVYRVILKSKDEDLISLEEELQFIESYIYLLKTRFEDNIRFHVEIKQEDKFKMIPPLTIQLLVENAIKHNIISEKKPLEVSIKSNDSNYLVVENSLFKKPEELREVGGSGLENIRKRYHYFSENRVEILEDDDSFKVNIPLLEVETV